MNLIEEFPSFTEYKFGWQLDLSFRVPRLVYKTRGSVCYLYRRDEIREHFDRKCFKNLEYLEGEQFCKEIKFQDAKVTALILTTQAIDEYHSEAVKIVITNR
jgi:hypothetical protein